MNAVRTLIALSALGCVVSVSARAETWSFPATGATREFSRSSLATSPFFDQLRGAGVHIASASTPGSAVLYLPVAFPSGTVLNWMSIRLQGIASGRVSADMYRQPTAGGVPVRMGTLGIENNNCSGVIVHWNVLNAAHAVDNFRYVYFVRLQLTNHPSTVTPSGGALRICWSVSPYPTTPGWPSRKMLYVLR